MLDGLQKRDSGVAAVQVEAAPLARPGTIFWRGVRDNAVAVLAWGGGYSALIVSVVILFPILQDSNTLMNVLDGLGIFDFAAGRFDGGVSALGTFEGYLAFQALGWAPTVLAVFTAPQIIGSFIIEERQGTLELILSTPITRSSVLIEKTAVVVVSLIGVLVIMWTSLIVSTRFVEETSHLSLQQANAAIWHIFPISMVLIAVALWLSTLFRSPRKVGGFVALFVMVSFFTRSLAAVTETSALAVLSRLSVYHYFSIISVLTTGVSWWADIGLLGVALIIMALALMRFQQRDLGV